MFAVVLAQAGPQWEASRPMEEQSGWNEHAAFMDGLVEERFILLGGPLVGQRRTLHVVEAVSEDAIRSTLALDPWSESHIVVESIEEWSIRLDGLRSAR